MSVARPTLGRIRSSVSASETGSVFGLWRARDDQPVSRLRVLGHSGQAGRGAKGWPRRASSLRGVMPWSNNQLQLFEGACAPGSVRFGLVWFGSARFGAAVSTAGTARCSAVGGLAGPYQGISSAPASFCTCRPIAGRGALCAGAWGRVGGFDKRDRGVGGGSTEAAWKSRALRCACVRVCFAVRVRACV